MKVKSTRPNATEITVSCHNCNYSERESFYGQGFLERRKSVTRNRSKARRHTQLSGHVVEVEVTFLSLYKPVEEE